MVKSKQENKPQKQNLPKTRNDWVRQRQAAEGTLGDKKARRRPNRTPASSGYATPPVKSAPDWDADSSSQSPRTQTAGSDLTRRRLGKMSPLASGFRSEPQTCRLSRQVSDLSHKYGYGSCKGGSNARTLDGPTLQLAPLVAPVTQPPPEPVQLAPSNGAGSSFLSSSLTLSSALLSQIVKPAPP